MAGVGSESRHAAGELWGKAQRTSPESLALGHLVGNTISKLTADFTATKCEGKKLFDSMIQDSAAKRSEPL